MQLCKHKSRNINSILFASIMIITRLIPLLAFQASIIRLAAELVTALNSQQKSSITIAYHQVYEAE